MTSPPPSIVLLDSDDSDDDDDDDVCRPSPPSPPPSAEQIDPATFDLERKVISAAVQTICVDTWGDMDFTPRPAVINLRPLKIVGQWLRHLPFPRAPVSINYEYLIRTLLYAPVRTTIDLRLGVTLFSNRWMNNDEYAGGTPPPGYNYAEARRDPDYASIAEDHHRTSFRDRIAHSTRHPTLSSRRRRPRRQHRRRHHRQWRTDARGDASQTSMVTDQLTRLFHVPIRFLNRRSRKLLESLLPYYRSTVRSARGVRSIRYYTRFDYDDAWARGLDRLKWTRALCLSILCLSPLWAYTWVRETFSNIFEQLRQDCIFDRDYEEHMCGRDQYLASSRPETRRQAIGAYRQSKRWQACTRRIQILEAVLQTLSSPSTLKLVKSVRKIVVAAS